MHCIRLVSEVCLFPHVYDINGDTWHNWDALYSITQNFIFSQNHVKLSDFGLSYLAGSSLRSPAVSGHPLYWPPEKYLDLMSPQTTHEPILTKPLNFAGDSYALGMIVLIMLKGEQPEAGDFMRRVC